MCIKFLKLNFQKLPKKSVVIKFNTPLGIVNHPCKSAGQKKNQNSNYCQIRIKMPEMYKNAVLAKVVFIAF